MKQHITRGQWNELNDKQRERWWNQNGKNSIPHLPHIENLNIGQMIEFLGEEWLVAPENSEDRKLGIYSIVWDKKIELCDELWEAVKYKLNEKHGNNI